MQPETEADGARRKRAEAEIEEETETEHEELRTFSNINTLAFVLKLWPGTCVAQTGLPMPYHHSPHRAFLISSNTCEQPERRHSGLGRAGERTLINNWHCCAV